MILLRTPDKKLKLQKQEMQTFLMWLDHAKSDGFTGIHFYHHAADRERLLLFSTYTLTEKVLNRVVSNTHQPPSKPVTVAVNTAEEIAFCTLYTRLTANDPYTLAILQKILQTLRPVVTTMHPAKKHTRQWTY